QLVYEVRSSGGLADAIDRHHIRVLEPGDRASLDDEPLALEPAGVDRRKELDRDGSIKQRVLSHVDLAHAAPTERPHQAVLVERVRRYPRSQRAHRSCERSIGWHYARALMTMRVWNALFDDSSRPRRDRRFLPDATIRRSAKETSEGDERSRRPTKRD